MYVPNASRQEVEKVLALQMDQVVPFTSGEYVFGFRLSDKLTSDGRKVVLGAMKTDLLDRALTDAKACGLKVRAVVPVAFGSWFLAPSDCAVVEIRDGVMGIDVIADGELRYSRSLPVPATRAQLDAEVERTFRSADTLATQIITIDGNDSRTPGTMLADAALVKDKLFSFALPGATESQRVREDSWRMIRAVGAAAIAVALGSYVYNTRFATQSQTRGRSATVSRQIKLAQTKQAAISSKLAAISNTSQILDVAFRPGQSISDVVTVLTATAPRSMWFTNLVIGHRAAVSVTGFAKSNMDVSDLAKDMTSDPRFREVKVVTASQTQIEKKPVFDFTISAKALGILPFDRAITGPRQAKVKK